MPMRRRAFQPQRIAERHHQLALPQVVRIAQRQVRQAGALDLDDRQIGLAIRADQLGGNGGFAACVRGMRAGSLTSIFRAPCTT